MIAWLNPSAVLAIAAVAVPLVIHLLLRQRARRIVVPSVRFVRRSDESALRMRAPSDLLLLAVRVAIVALAALALMQPLLLSPARRSTWAGRVVRAIVVDISESVDAVAIRAAADAEDRDAFAARRFESMEPGAAVERAVAWLNIAPPARREVVLLSDFQLGAVMNAQVNRVPKEMGIRAVRIGRPAGRANFTAATVMHGDALFAAHVELDDAGTGVTLISQPRSLQGLELLGDARQREGIDTVLRTVRQAGAISPAPEQPIVVRFAGSAVHDQDEEPLSSWARRSAVRLLISPVLEHTSPRVTQRGGALVVDVDVAAGSWQAAAVVQAALNARFDQREWKEREPLTVADDQLRAWTRQAPPPAADAWRHGNESDSRWFWVAALLLMGVEMLVRRLRPQRNTVENARAA